jgi:hypothetical protein
VLTEGDSDGVFALMADRDGDRGTAELIRT